MKNSILSGIFFICLVTLAAQPPQAFKYQAVARNANGDLLTNQSVTFRMSIHQSIPTGTIVYQEIHPVVTNDYGMASLEIGNGIPLSGTFTSIYWDLYDHFLQVEIDPDGGTNYLNMGTSKFLSVPYALYAEDNPYWDLNGSHIILKSSGNVGIGSYSPSSRLEVRKDFSSTNTVEDLVEILRGSTGTVEDGMGAGLIFRNEVSNGAYSLSGRIASIMENVNIGSTTAGMLFQTRPSSGLLNSAMYINPEGSVGISEMNPNANLDINGDIRVDYAGSNNAIRVFSLTSSASVYIENDYPGNTWGLSSGITDNTAGTNSYGLYGFNYGLGKAVYGVNYNNGIGVYGTNTASGNYGYLGSFSNAVYGENNNGNYGHIAGTYGVYGRHGDGNYGYIGGSLYGVYANLVTNNPGDYGMYGYGVDASGEDGTNYTQNGTLGGVKGYNYYGNPYTFGIAGYSYLDYDRSGGAFGGKYNGSVWGSMGYQRVGGTEYGGYFTSYTTGTGKEEEASVNVGIGAWGDLFGADIHGKIYGAYIEGSNYATYANGLVFKNDLDIHLQNIGKSENIVLYTSVATDVTVQTCGYATLTNGKTTITFDQQFSNVLSPLEPVIVTATPMGKSGSVYLSEVSNKGFTIEENGDAKSNITVSYIAIGKRKGFEYPQLPQEVIASDYTSKLEQGLHNDNDMESDGAGLYYQNGQLMVGKHPSTFPDMSKKPEEQNNIEKPEKRITPENGNGKAPVKDHE